MPFDIPDDAMAPDLPAPAAVVRRQGESYEQAGLRKAGYSDLQTGQNTSASSRGNMANPLERAWKIAAAKEREARMVSQNAQEQSNFEREQALKEGQFAAQQRLHAAAQQDKATALEQMGYLLDEQDQLAQKFGRGSREYMLGALSMARKYPAAVMADPRLGQQLNHYDTVLTNAGVTDEVKQAVSEIGQADPSQPGMLSYIDTIPAKYPGIVNDPHIMTLFNTKRKEAAAAALQQEAKAAGLVADKAIVDTAGGNLSMTNPKAEKEAKAAKASPLELYQDAMASSAPVYGQGDSLKDFKPTVAGKDAQTHVKVAFQDPSGKPHETVIERGLFDSMVAASKARQGAAAPGKKDSFGALTDEFNALGTKATAEQKAAIAKRWAALGGKSESDKGGNLKLTLPGGNDAPAKTDKVAANKDFSTPDEVKAAFRSGALTREAAKELLQSKFGHP